VLLPDLVGVAAPVVIFSYANPLMLSDLRGLPAEKLAR
jgi:hypothetical protein